jgi:hypothetical protein
MRLQGPKLVFLPILVVNWVSSCLSFFLSSSTDCCYIYFRCSYLYNYYNYSRLLSFADTIERGDRGVKAGSKRGWRQGDFTELFQECPCPWPLITLHLNHTHDFYIPHLCFDVQINRVPNIISFGIYKCQIRIFLITKISISQLDLQTYSFYP